MERLIYSSSPTPLKPSPPSLKTRLYRVDSLKTSTRPLTFISLRNPFYRPAQLSRSPFSAAGSSSNDSGNETLNSSDNFKIGGLDISKVVSAGRIIALCALISIIAHPLLASPAFASFQAATKRGGAAAASSGGKLIKVELLSSAWTGFFAGCLHTLSGPDHLAALAPLSIGRTEWKVLLLEHFGVVAMMLVRVVGFTLLVIGAMGIKEASEVPTPCVALENGECDVSAYEMSENPAGGKKKIGFATFATGIVHGLQPDALMMVLPALALPSRLAGAAFLGMFLLGTVFAMGSYTVFIGSCSQALKDKVPRITEKLTWASSLVAIGLGLAILISQFFGFSLY